MKVKAYSKSIIREINMSKSRFISILIIILLGVAFYSGIKSTGPNMRDSVESFYQEQNLMDSKISSSLGLSENDLKLLENNDEILMYQGSHTVDANLTNENSVVRFMEYDHNLANINSYYVVEGRLPEKAGEIALDEQAVESGRYKIGDTFKIECDDDTKEKFSNTEFNIVGIVRSPLYMDKTLKGNTTIGKGKIDYFAVINKDDYSMDIYTEIYVKFKNTEGLKAYSDEYNEKMEENTEYLKQLYSERPKERTEEIKEEALAEIKAKYAEAGILGLEGLNIEEKLPEISEAKYYFFDRNDNQGYSEFKDVINRLNSIATVFPMFFFIVAILICLTTMTRMVEENRTEIGTLKALGYSNYEIAKKYVIYASLASITGGVVGVLIGFNLFPRIIYTAYSNQYYLPSLAIHYYTRFIIQALVISILCTVGAALVVLKVDLNSSPSELMRPKAPKMGKRILLERITPIWRRLNFNQKVTFRNLFRYKQRMIMTVFGISACMAMIITGLGLKNSINGLTDKQFNKLWKYQAIVILNDNSSAEESEEYTNELKGLKCFEESLDMHQEAITISKENINKQSVTLFVPSSKDEFKDFVLLNNRLTSEEYDLSNEGAIITEKLAKLLNIKIGDVITIASSENDLYEIKISNIAENYLSHSMYLTKEYYEAVFGKEPSFNSQFIKFNENQLDEDYIASTLMKTKKVINISMTSSMAKATNDAMDMLNIVVVILIISAGGLAFVVLYNLNNINVSERIRELSTIKVLGFYNHEVTMYILRENFILTALGIVIGMFMGKILHGFVTATAEADNMMFSPEIYASSYVYSIILTLLFSFIVMLLMHRKLKKVNMIDALKSNE